MRVLGGALLGAVIGVLCTSFGLIDASAPETILTGGNQFTPIVTGAGVLIGAAVGTTAFFRRHTFSFLTLALVLLLAIVLRDRYLLQPPVVFVDLFGLPLLGATLGLFVDRWRAKKEPRPPIVIGFGIGLVVIAFGVSLILVPRFSSDCKTRGRFTVCSFKR